MKKFRESFAAQLSVFVALLASLIFFVNFATNFYYSRQAIKDEAEKLAMCELDNTVLRLNNILNTVENSANNMYPFITRHLADADSMYAYARMIVENNPVLTGCSLAFEPEHFKNKGHYYSIYAGREEDGSITIEQEGSKTYDYHYLDWYQIPKLLNSPYWTDPYNDVYEDPETGKLQIEQIFSYSMPIHDKQGNFVGVMALDIDQQWLSKIINNMKPYPNSHTIALGRGGVYLVHPDSTIIGNETIFTETLEGDFPEIRTVGELMTSAKRGMYAVSGENVTGGEDSYVFYTPLKRVGWSIGIVCPEGDIFGGYNRLKMWLIVMMAVGIFLMMVVCILVIRKRVHPLERLARSANVIARGNFDKEVPVIRGDDEIALLSRAFRDMQHSLVDYIEELKTTTANKERIEGELRIAHDIQMGMIPKIFPPYPDRKDIDIYASLTPAKEVGGDLYDFLILGEKFYFVIGDVSGKGIPASLLMAVCRNLFRTVAAQGLTPQQIVRSINDTMGESNESGMFITLFVGVIDLATGHLSFCNAGHNPPVIIPSDGKPAFMDLVPNIPAGLFDGFDFEAQEYPSVDGVTLFLYTDGLTEAENKSQELFGDNHLIDILTGKHHLLAKDLVELASNSVVAHANGAEQSDDLTIMVIRININKKI